MKIFRICPSILNADRDNLPSEISRIAQDSDFLHLDVMDNIFVPNFTFSFSESEEIIGKSPLPVDAHLMIANPDEMAVAYAKAGSASVTFHLEAAQAPFEIISGLKACGARVGVGIKPATPFEAVEELLPLIDMLLVMTVEPGFGGQSFMSDMLPKVSKARTFIDLLPDPKPWLEVDGGISLNTISQAATAGADTFVAGSAVFTAPIPGEMIKSLRVCLAESIKEA